VVCRWSGGVHLAAFSSARGEETRRRAVAASPQLAPTPDTHTAKARDKRARAGRERQEKREEGHCFQLDGAPSHALPLSGEPALSPEARRGGTQKRADRNSQLKKQQRDQGRREEKGKSKSGPFF